MLIWEGAYRKHLEREVSFITKQNKSLEGDWKILLSVRFKADQSLNLPQAEAGKVTVMLLPF